MKKRLFSDRLNKRVLQKALDKDATGVCLYVYPSCPSTNDEAKRAVADGFSGMALFVAEEQTAGRGRQGKSFFSPPGSGVYFTLLLTDVPTLADAVPVTSATAVAVMRAVRRLTGKQTAIKWVNDLYLDEKKVCGILTEAIVTGDRQSVAVGIGINLRPAVFPPELTAIAGSIGDASVTRAELIAGVIRELLPYLRDPASRAWLEEYRSCSCVIGKKVAWLQNGETTEGTAVGIDRDGGLTVRLPDGSEQTLRTGEITLRVGGS